MKIDPYNHQEKYLKWKEEKDFDNLLEKCVEHLGYTKEKK